MSDSDIIRFTCPHCGKGLRAKTELAGKSVRCSNGDCRQPIVIPASDLEQLPPLRTTQDSAAEFFSDLERGSPQVPRQHQMKPAAPAGGSPAQGPEAATPASDVVRPARFGDHPQFGRQDHCFIRDLAGTIRGAWVRNSADAHNRTFMIALFLQGGLSSEGIVGQVRIIPNTSTDEGGCFVMLGTFPAPGERQTSAQPLKKPAKYGGMMEPYCSEQCATASDRATGQAFGRSEKGMCKLCGANVHLVSSLPWSRGPSLSPGHSRGARVQFNGGPLFVCEACAQSTPAPSDSFRVADECFWCGAKLAVEVAPGSGLDLSTWPRMKQRLQGRASQPKKGGCATALALFAGACVAAAFASVWLI